MNEFSPSFNAPAVQNYGTWNGLPVTYANGVYSAGDYTLTPQKGGAGYNISGYTGSTAPVGTGTVGQIWAPPSAGNNWVGQWTTPSTNGTGGLFGQGGGFLGIGDSQALLGAALAAYAGGSALAGSGSAAAGAEAAGAAGAAGSAAAPAVIDAAGNLIGGELATGVATSAPVYQGALGGWGALGAGAASMGAAQASQAAAQQQAAQAAATAPTAYTGSGLTAGSGTTGLTSAGGAGLTAGSTLGNAAATDVAANTLAPSLGATGLMGAGAAAAGAGTAGSLLSGVSNGSLLGTGLNLAGGLVQGQAATDAAKTQADAQIRAAQIAADAAKFKPVGVTTGFGSSQFGFDANGNLNSAGYNLTPEMKAQRDALIAQSNGLLSQAGGAQAATAPMSQAAQTMMGLGQGYLATSPQEQAQKYLNDQLGLLSPQRASDMAALQAQMQAQGRGGFAIGGGVNGQGAANPQLQALYNAQMQQNNQLAANATQGGMDYAKFGADMVGSGGNMLSSMYGVQNSAYNPYNTALQGANTVEQLGQNAMTLGANLGNTATAASAASGNALAQGVNNAANTMAPANAYSPWANILGGAGNMLSQYKFGQ